jgi:O-antigen/teichoic acid export membrane protein
MKNNSRFSRNIILVLDNIIPLIVLFIINIISARNLSVTDFGIFTLLYGIYSFIAALQNAVVLEPTLIFSFGKFRNNLKEYIQFSMSANFIFIVIVFILMLLIGNIFNSKINLTVIISICLMLFGLYVRRVMILKSEYYLLAAFIFLSSFITGIIIKITLILNMISYDYIFLAMGLGWCIFTVLFYIMNYSKFETIIFLNKNKTYLKDHFHYSKWTFLTAFVIQFSNQGYFWLLAMCVSADDVGVFKALQILVFPFLVINGIVSAIAFPSLSSMITGLTKYEANYINMKYSIILLLGAIFYFIFILTFGNYILKIIYDTKYSNEIFSLYILGLFPITSCISVISGEFLKIMLLNKLIFIAYLAAGIITLLAGIPLVYVYGVAGASYGFVCANIVYSFIIIFGYITSANKYKFKVI